MHTVINSRGENTIKTIRSMKNELQRWFLVERCEYVHNKLHIKITEGFEVKDAGMIMNIIHQYVPENYTTFQCTFKNKSAVFIVSR